MEMVLNNGFCEMTMDEMFLIDGGGWSWRKLFKTILGGAAGGAAGGTVAGGPAGAGLGAAGGAAGGALSYLVCGWW